MTDEFSDYKRGNKQIEGRPGERMASEYRAPRERSMQNLALRPEFMAGRFRQALEKEDKAFTLENLALMLGTSEYAAWTVALEPVPLTARELREAEYRAQLPLGALEAYVSGA